METNNSMSTPPTPEQQSQPQRLMPEPRSSRNAWIAGTVIVVVVIAAIAGGYYWYKQQAQSQQQPAVITPINTNASPDSTADQNVASPVPTGPSLPTVPTSADYKVSGMVNWQTPAKIAAVKAFDPAESTAADRKLDQAFLVGTFISGPYQGADFLVIEPGCECPGGAQLMARVARQGTKYTVLGKYSDPIYTTDPAPGTPTPKYSVDKDFRLSDLEFPVTILGTQPRQIVRLESSYPGYEPFIKDANVIEAFVDPKMGSIYTNIVDPNKNLDDAFMIRNGYYLKAPDGSLITYSLVIDFVGTDNVPQVTWTGGQKNAKEYTYKDVSGCGAYNFVSVVSPKQLAMKDLSPTGTTSKGDTVYVTKDVNNKILKDLYDNNYYVPEGQTKLSYSDYVKARPLFFWVDPFNRLVKFENSQFLPQAECGKPVIYLYPEQREQVSVQLAPQGGFSYTEPAYKNGWNVMADPSGTLTELSSNQQYPYLFWEGRGGYYKTPDKGFVVARADVPKFLDSKLSLLGLNGKEAGDFKDFWQPKMQSAPYYFVTFMGNETMNQIAPLTVTPKPDTVIRILMDFKPLQKPIAVDSYPIRTPVRRGFTVVEWGGVLR